MKHVVITGSTRGIGFGMARQFLKKGCQVTINGTTADGVQNAKQALATEFSEEHLFGVPGDVSKEGDVRRLWEDSVLHIGPVDIWINNAGIDQQRKLVWEMKAEEYKRVLETNVVGVIHGSSVAFNGMLEQGKGQIYNMEGFGSNGMMRERMTIYGTSKSAVRYFTRSLSLEARETPIMVGTLSPGMVATDILRKSLESGGKEAEQSRKIFNILADEVETVTPYLVEKILENKKNGAQIEWLTKPKIFWRFASSPFIKRSIFNEMKS